MGVGRVLCVALPFILTVGSLIFLLIATLGGVTNTGLYVFRVNLTDLSINPSQIPKIGSRSVETDLSSSLLTAREAFAIIEREPKGGKGSGSSGSSSDSGSGSSNSGSGGASQAQAATGGNVTAADLGLGNLYDVSLWGYCRTGQDGARTCTKAQFDWAASTVNSTTNDLMNFANAATGQQVTIPKETRDVVNAFATLAKWTEVVFIIALISLGVELFFGIFANCSRAWSCVTFIVASIASVAVVGAAAMATTMAALVVGGVEGTARWYGVSSSFNVTFLSLIWISAALALGAGFFWLFTICCCAPNHSRRDRKRNTQDAEKLLPTGAYQPLHEPEHNGFYNNNNNAPQYGAPRYPSGAPRSDIAYEPYSHRG